jgi:hypothetical protein
VSSRERGIAKEVWKLRGLYLQVMERDKTHDGRPRAHCYIHSSQEHADAKL